MGDLNACLLGKSGLIDGLKVHDALVFDIGANARDGLRNGIGAEGPQQPVASSVVSALVDPAVTASVTAMAAGSFAIIFNVSFNPIAGRGPGLNSAQGPARLHVVGVLGLKRDDIR